MGKEGSFQHEGPGGRVPAAPGPSRYRPHPQILGVRVTDSDDEAKPKRQGTQETEGYSTMRKRPRHVDRFLFLDRFRQDQSAPF